MLRPSRISRYVLYELAAATLLGVAVWTVFLLLNDLFFIARAAIQKDLGIGVVLRIFFLKIPNVLVLSIPIGTLFGSLIAIGRLSADHELVALQAVGIGPRRLAGIMVIHGLVTGVSALAIYAFLHPWASYELRSMQGRFLNVRNISTELRPRVFYDRLPNYVLFVDEIRAGTQGSLDRTIVYQIDPARRGYEQIILARSATLEPAPGGPSRLRIVFHDGIQNIFRVDDPESYRSTQFDKFWSPPIIPPAWMLPTGAPAEKTVADMTPRELAREWRASSAEADKLLKPYRMRSVRGQVHQRLALPFASFLFALLALPLGMTRARSGKGAGFALSFVVVLAYWLIFTVGTQQAREGRIPVVVGYWSSNVVIAVWALIAYLRLRSGASTGRLSRRWSTLRAQRPGRSVPQLAENGEALVVAARRRPFRLSAVLDRYIGMLYVRMLVLALSATYLIFSLIELKGILDSVVERRQSPALILSYFQYFLPGALVLTLPFAAMIGAVVAVTLLSRNGEITAIKAGGMSARRLCLPILAVTALGCVTLFIVQDRIAPETNRRAQAEKDRIQGRNPRTYGIPSGGRWTFGDEGRLYHYRTFDSQENRFQGLSVFRVDLAKARILEQWFAASAVWSGDAWQLENGWTRRFPVPGSSGEFKRFDKLEAPELDPPENFTRPERMRIAGNDLAEQVSLEELGEQIAELSRSGYDTTRLRVQFWQKTASSFTPFVMVLLGLPFAFKVGRRGSMYGVGVGLLLAIVYWATAAIFNALGLETILPPFLAAWSPNVIFGALGAYFFLFIPT
jgi:LPS export ABC transporter permease LptG/LPS export ABC transporter permease LptF